MKVRSSESMAPVESRAASVGVTVTPIESRAEDGDDTTISTLAGRDGGFFFL